MLCAGGVGSRASEFFAPGGSRVCEKALGGGRISNSLRRELIIGSKLCEWPSNQFRNEEIGEEKGAGHGQENASSNPSCLAKGFVRG